MIIRASLSHPLQWFLSRTRQVLHSPVHLAQRVHWQCFRTSSMASLTLALMALSSMDRASEQTVFVREVLRCACMATRVPSCVPIHSIGICSSFNCVESSFCGS